MTRSARKAPAASAARESIANKIRALLSKTTEKGATEAEAIAAAEKAGELMRAHLLTMTDIEVKAGPIGDALVDRRNPFRLSPADRCLRGIQAHCGVRIWYHTVGRSAQLRMLGLQADVEMARWLYLMITGAIVRGDAEFFKTLPHGREHSLANRRACTSFQFGMAREINERLIDMAEAAKNARTASGTALVVVKAPIVENALAALQQREGWKFGEGRSSGVTLHDFEAYQAGKAAGAEVNLSRPVEAEDRQQIGR